MKKITLPLIVLLIAVLGCSKFKELTGGPSAGGPGGAAIRSATSSCTRYTATAGRGASSAWKMIGVGARLGRTWNYGEGVAGGGACGSLMP